MEINNTQIKRNDTDTLAGQVSLPFNKEQFKNFIVSLLGKPQTITKKYRGNFELTKENVYTIFETLNQRIYQQNDAQLIQFRATIYYNDNSTVTLSGYEHFVHYNENLPLVSIGLHLTWQYLIKFRDKDNYEKQEISLSFISNSNVVIDGHDGLHNYQPVSLLINHTARTWGADIEGVISKYLQSIVKPSSRIINFFKYDSIKVENLLYSIILIITLILSIWRYYDMSSKISIHDTPFWIQYFGKHIFLFLGLFSLAKITAVLLEEFDFYSSNSSNFLLLTSESYHYREKVKNSMKKRYFKYFATFIGSILLSIISNILYSKLFV